MIREAPTTPWAIGDLLPRSRRVPAVPARLDRAEPTGIMKPWSRGGPPIKVDRIYCGKNYDLEALCLGKSWPSTLRFTFALFSV